jgi:hypothetical protein
MVKVIALVRGYFGGKIIEAGEAFGVPAEIWNDKKLRPKWAREPGEADDKAEVEEVADDDDKPKAKAKAGKGKAKPETVKAPTAKPFEDAPAPVRAKSEINDALGTTQPDWIAPGGAPQAVTD